MSTIKKKSLSFKKKKKNWKDEANNSRRKKEKNMNHTFFFFNFVYYFSIFFLKIFLKSKNGTTHLKFYNNFIPFFFHKNFSDPNSLIGSNFHSKKKKRPFQKEQRTIFHPHGHRQIAQKENWLVRKKQKILTMWIKKKRGPNFLY